MQRYLIALACFDENTHIRIKNVDSFVIRRTKIGAMEAACRQQKNLKHSPFLPIN